MIIVYPTLRPGTKITCPACHVEIARVKIELSDGDIVDIELYDFSQDGHDNGKKLTCRDCGAAFIKGYVSQIHTEFGWFPPFH